MPDSVIEFFVPGKPEPAGSKRAFPIRAAGKIRVAVTDANPKSRDWKVTVSWVAKDAFDGEIIDVPLDVEMDFVVQRPASHYGTGKNSWSVRASAPRFPASKPDVLKLARGVEDALTGVIWTDDALIVNERISKRYGDEPGVRVRITHAR